MVKYSIIIIMSIISFGIQMYITDFELYDVLVNVLFQLVGSGFAAKYLIGHRDRFWLIWFVFYAIAIIGTVFFYLFV